MSTSEHRDVVVIGAGTAGAAAAYCMARRGLDVLLADARPLEEGGARWVNALPMWMFDEARIPRPVAPELRGRDQPFALVSPSGQSRTTLQENPACPVDMRLLVARLIGLAAGAGAETAGRLQLEGVDTDADGRPRVVTFRGPEGERRVGAALFVDATGVKGALRRRVPLLEQDCPPVSRHDTCSAAQEVVEIVDAEGARRFLDRWRIAPGETRCLLGQYGGYSIVNVLVEEDFSTADLLTGSIADGVHASGPQIIADLRRAEPWLGPRIFGGAGTLPLRRPYDRLAVPGAALIGDAACQNFAAHGSGIGMGMVAAGLLAEAIHGHEDPGSLEAVWTYQRRFHRRWGGLLAGYELMRRLAQSLGRDEIERLLRVGLLSPNLVHAGMDQRPPPLSLTDLPGAARATLSDRSIVARAVSFLGRFPALLAHYRVFPARPDEARLRRWSWVAGNLAGDRPDLRPSSP